MKLARRWEAFWDWMNDDVKVRRIDIALCAFGVLTVAYHWYFDGLPTALAAGLLYVMIVMVCVWMI
jgi:hypothetical protein